MTTTAADPRIELSERIAKLRAQRKAVILAHNYQLGEVQDIADITGDSLQLAREAVQVKADVIVLCGVIFMAETAKLLNPQRTVLIPDPLAGCPMCDMAPVEELRLRKAQLPGVPVVAYVNTTADVKAETDICCTSANAVQVVEWAAKEWGVDRVILIPDEFLARNVAAQTNEGIIAWKGRCEVHERFTADDIAEMRAAYPGAEILAHPECPEEVLAASDFAGSTAAMSDYVTQRKPKQVVMITECSMASNVAADSPDTRFIGPCNLCPHMKRITLENIRDCLVNMQFEVTVPEALIEPARRAVQRMVDLPPPEKPARYDLVRARHHVDVELI